MPEKRINKEKEQKKKSLPTKLSSQKESWPTYITSVSFLCLILFSSTHPFFSCVSTSSHLHLTSLSDSLKDFLFFFVAIIYLFSSLARVDAILNLCSITFLGLILKTKASPTLTSSRLIKSRALAVGRELKINACVKCIYRKMSRGTNRSVFMCLLREMYLPPPQASGLRCPVYRNSL